MLRAVKILIASDTYPPDVNGAAYFSYRLAMVLAKRGHEASVICPSRGVRAQSFLRQGVRVFGVHSLPLLLYPEFRFSPPLLVADEGRPSPPCSGMTRISREGPMVCRLAGGGNRIRTVGPAGTGYSLLIMKSLSATDSAPQTSPFRPASCRTLA